MSIVKNSSTIAGGGNNNNNSGTSGGHHNTETPIATQRTTANNAIVKCGCLKKLKTSRKKFFVLRAETADSSARLEYYDSERKFNGGLAPKRSIPLKTCFNINKRLDTKYKHVIALYTKDDCFGIVFDCEDDLDVWLKALLSLQHGEEIVDGETPRPTFEHVWQVTVLNRGLGTSGGLTGNYRLCLTDRTLSLIKRECETSRIELNLANIRSCGNLKDFFFLEIGRSSTLGAGELWMETEDHNIAQNIHSTVFHAMSTNGTKEELGPKSRNRSSSATESSKPNSMGRKQILSGLQKPHILSQDVSHSNDIQVPCTSSSSTSQHPIGLTGGGCRERCDSMPSRARTTSEGNHPIPLWNHHQGRHLIPHRPISLYGRDISHSPPSGGSPVSPPSVGCSTDSAGSSYSLADEIDINELDQPMLSGLSGGGGGRYSHSLTPDEAIAEEDCLDSPSSLIYGISPSSVGTAIRNGGSYLMMAPQQQHHHHQTSSDDGYVDMSPRSGRNNHLTVSSPTASLSSITSGTPSTDLRFIEYQLEKVTSYFAPSSDDDNNSSSSLSSRPIRAYSVGSRPNNYGGNSKLSYGCYGGDSNNSRVRAFSVGSKTKKSYPNNRILPPHTTNVHSTNSTTGGKSSSAPILNCSFSGNGSNGRLLQGSHGSIGPMDDLMEMDFSGGGGLTLNNNNTTNTTTATDENYMDMKGGNSSNNKTPSGYVEMKPPGGADKLCTMHRGVNNQEPNNSRSSSAYLDMRSSSSVGPGGSSAQDHAFVDLNRHYKNFWLDSLKNNDYTWTSLKKNMKNFNRSKNRSNSSTCSRCEQCSSTDSIDGGGQINTTTTTTNPQTPDGYVQMTLGTTPSGGRHHQRQSSLDSAKINQNHKNNSDDYTNMSFGSGSSNIGSPSSSTAITTTKKRHNSGGSSKKVRSQPIAILAPPASSSSSLLLNNNQKKKSTHKRNPATATPTTTAAATVNIGGRKYSSGTPPKLLHLPLNNNNNNHAGCYCNNNSGGSSSTSPSSYSSLPRQQRSRKNSSILSSSSGAGTTPRRDSKDSSNSSSSVTTPSSSSTIFPISLNSPCSPIIAGDNNNSSNNKTDSNGYTVMDFASSTTTNNTNQKIKSKSTATSSKMSSGGDDGDYVNYNPAITVSGNKKQQQLHQQKNDDSGDYAVMKPGAVVMTGGGDTSNRVRLTTTTTPIAILNLNDDRTNITTNNNNTSRFRPINENNEATVGGGDIAMNNHATTSRINNASNIELNSTSNISSGIVSSSTTNNPKLLSRPNSTSSELGGSSSSSTIIGGSLSRPDSVNSDRIRPSSSVSSDSVQLHYASLDLDDNGVCSSSSGVSGGGGVVVAGAGGSRSPRVQQQQQQNQQLNNGDVVVVGQSGDSPLTYAAIDFIKSENLNCNNNNTNNSDSLSTTINSNKISKF